MVIGGGGIKLYSIIFGLFNITFTMYRDVPKVSGHCNFLLYISYKTTIFENIIPKSILV
jgi:hypothetical protein